MTLKQKRRAILKSLGIGSAWSTPVVSSVFLPAHASTSSAPVNEEFLSAGTDKFTVPAGVTQLKIAVNGAGGGTRNIKDQEELRVGGNGEQVIQTVTTVPGDTLNITVGGGGHDGWDSKDKDAPDDAGRGGIPGDGGDASSKYFGGGGGGYSQVSGTGISIQAGGGGGASNYESKVGGVGGGTNGGAAGAGSDGGHAGNGLGGIGSSTEITDNSPPLKGEDGSVIISST